MELLVPDAADRLGVSAGRVRDLIRSGDLPARQVAGRWFIDAADIEAAKGRPAGRPLSPRMAWGLISMVESGDAAALDRAERSKLRRRLRALPSPDQVADRQTGGEGTGGVGRGKPGVGRTHQKKKQTN